MSQYTNIYNALPIVHMLVVQGSDVRVPAIIKNITYINHTDKRLTKKSFNKKHPYKFMVKNTRKIYSRLQ